MKTLPCFFAASACALACLTSASASPGAIVVFNELQYNPPGATEDGEWIELFNQQGIKVDLSGWRIDGLGYTFPQGTIIDPGAYVVVAKSPAAGQLGSYPGNMDNGGERLRLFNQSARLMDEIDFADDAPWPAGADGSGATLAKRKPYTDGAAPENWSTSKQVGGTPGTMNFPGAGAPPPTSTVGLVALADEWRYNESGADLGAGWATTAHAVGGGWASGPGGLGSETGPTIPLGTLLTQPFFNNPRVVTYYFEHEFDLTGAQLAGLQSLKVRHGFDDGGIVYLNGIEILRVNLPVGVITASTLALNGNEVDELSTDIPVPSGALVAGTNRLSVEVHQESTGSSDIVFGLELDAEIADAVPGAGPQIVLNEIPPVGEPAFWIELRNSGVTPVELAGISISVGADPLREYSLPAGQIAPGALLLLDEATLGFHPLSGEKLFVYNAGKTAVLDARQVTGRLRGRMGDEWLYPSSATPGSANTFQTNTAVVISEIAFNPPSLPAIGALTEETTLVAMANTWRYNAADESLPPGWAGSAHAVGGNWSQGPGPIGREASALAVPLATDLVATYQPGTITYYFETEFTVTAAQRNSFATLLITHQIDDGAVFYLNGIEVGRFNMLPGAVNPETLASPSVGDASLDSTAVPVGALVAGQNRLSVEVHQSSTGSSDMVFGVALGGTVQIQAAQPFRNSNNQWVEVANRSGSAVDISGWEFSDGIGITFPTGTILSPGEHACVVRDTNLFSAAYPGARVLGQFSGSLSRSGERLQLRDAARNPVDVVRYYDGGAWPEAADGGGSSLELRDLDADNAVGGAWAASDESGRTAWKTYSYTKTATSTGGPDGQWSEFNMGMMGSGEILIDDITVTGVGQSIADPGFNNPSAWRLRGNHRHSEIIDDPGGTGKVLRLVATGPTEHMHNQVETTLTGAINSSNTYTISFRARWVSGSSQLHSRLWFNRCANVNVLDRPSDPGTPSAPNSMAESSIGPTFTGLKHDPPVPAAGEVTTVSVAASDPDGVSSMTLFYSVNGGGFQSAAMTAIGGRYEAGVPGQSAGATVQFYIAGSDSGGAGAFFPPEGPLSRALYKVNDGLAATNGWHNFRVLLTAADVAFQHSPTEVMSNDRLPCTVIDREGDIYYNCGVRLKSSERGRNQLPRVGYNISFPADGLYRGCHGGVAIDRSEGQSPGQRELLFDMMISNSGGVLSRYYDFVKVLAPNSALTGGATFQLGRYDEIFLDSQFENGSEGNVFEYELIYYQTTADGNGLKLPYPSPDGVVGVAVSDRGDDPERYRWFFLNKINREADDFSPIIAYNKKMSQSGVAFETGLGDVVAIDDWLRGMAYAVLSGAGDNAAAGSQHNGLYYAKPGGRVMFLPHDMDFSFDANRTIFANGECAKLTADPARRRLYLGHLHDIISTTYNQNYMAIWSTHFNEFDPTQGWSADLSYCVQRSNNVLSQINGQVAPVAFTITTPSPLAVASGTATVVGDGWVNVREIRIQGNTEPLPVTWTDNNSWRVVLPAPAGQSTITLEAVNFSGAVIGSETIAINNTTPSNPASASNLVVSELMYHPADGAGEEFIEVMNIGAALVDLTGARFIAGIDYEFADGSALNPGERMVILASQFLHGTALANGGERLHLIDVGGSTIKDFTYDDSSPWPEAADGDGYSLVLIDPNSNPNHGLASNWRTSTLPGGNPGSADSVAFAGDPDADNDGDGVSAFLEHAVGGSDLAPAPAPTAITGLPGTFIFQYTRNLAADDVVYTVESSDDLVGWMPASGFIQSNTPLGDGRSVVRFALASTRPSLTVRLRVESRQ